MVVQGDEALAIKDSPIRLHENARLADLMQQLALLRPGQICTIETGTYAKLVGENNIWSSTRSLSDEFECDIQFHPGGWVRIFKRVRN
jgi:hypothetical protein